MRPLYNKKYIDNQQDSNRCRYKMLQLYVINRLVIIIILTCTIEFRGLCRVRFCTFNASKQSLRSKLDTKAHRKI